ncbi:hypothetical protein FSP39_022313 [Pinctada imbricata]|uniref:Uncharacterized protein n=1 Tax=Pinctada imbricata TaxID=66713 RepID=A0AA88XEE1_PINIB|nr:hypothetical protein FSP39_022313 [Pinctada imbricata]
MLLLIPFLSILSHQLISASSNNNTIIRPPNNATNISALINWAVNVIVNASNAEYYGKTYKQDYDSVYDPEDTHQDEIPVSSDGLKPKDWTWKKVQAGVEAGTAIVTAIGSDTHSARFLLLGKISKNLAPFLGAIGPALGLLNFFISKGPSPELQLMLREFARINAKFDQVFAKIDNLEKVIIEKAVKSQYGIYQSEISALSHLLNDYLNISSTGASNDTKESRKNKFLEEYDKSDSSATLKLWQGMTRQRVLMDYIPDSVARFTKNHRLLTQNILKRILNTIIQGVNVMLYRDQMIGDTDTYEDQKTLWDGRIQQLIAELIEFDLKVAKKYSDQSKKDTDDIISSLFGVPNKAVADALYSSLSEKYDWRNWLVVVYDPLHGGDKHWVHYCGGLHRFRTHGRNTVVASISQYYSKMDKESVKKKLFATPLMKKTSSYWWWEHFTRYKCFDAHVIFDHIHSDIRNGCKYPGLGVIRQNADIHYRAPNDHFVVVQSSCRKNKFQIHAFR